MRQVTLGSTGITVPQNAFGALPIQRVSTEMAVKLLRRAYEGGMRFFDTARAYSDSEVKVGEAFDGMRDKSVYRQQRPVERTPEEVKVTAGDHLYKISGRIILIFTSSTVPISVTGRETVPECMSAWKN